jgi:hypothetical protein
MAFWGVSMKVCFTPMVEPINCYIGLTPTDIAVDVGLKPN